MTVSEHPFKKYITIFWSIFGIGILLIIILFSLVANGKLGFMPTLTELETIESSLASEVYSSDSVVMRKFFYKENRSYVPYEQISKNVITALIATEDERFYQHSGIDIRGLLRVAKGIVTGDQSSGGGSTISQQLAKMLFPREEMDSKKDLAFRKFREWIIAVKLERNFTKEEILTMYLNKFDFLNLAVGIKSASQIYFGITPDKLSLEQAAMLIGMAKNPSLYNPLRRPEIVKQRRNVVLDQVRKFGAISKAEYNAMKIKDLQLNYHKEDFKSSPGTYFTEYLRTILMSQKPDREKYGAWQNQQFYEDSLEWETNPLYGWCNKNRKPDGSPYNIHSDGLKIYSTIDMRMQTYAEYAIRQHLSIEIQPVFNQRIKILRNPPFPNSMSDEEAHNLLNYSVKQSERYRQLRSQGMNQTEILKEFSKP
ncbi:MAG TPA: transglycosylase domain-containing protein, partial [Prolixibacteraceae bacterium]